MKQNIEKFGFDKMIIIPPNLEDDQYSKSFDLKLDKSDQ